MVKYTLPPVQKILQTKTIYGAKKDPVWVYLEKEMQENSDKKPYNEKVGKWLRFLKDLKYHYYTEGKRKVRRLQKEVGPRWYVELSSQQKEVLAHVKDDIHQDLLEDIPRRMRQNLSDLGITNRVPRKMLMQAMDVSVEDPGVFFWKLYQSIYKKSPSELLYSYDMDARILISCLVFIDMEECIETLNRVTHYDKSISIERPRKKKKYFQPDVKYGEYLQQMYVPLYTNPKLRRNKKPLPLGYKLKLRSEESYERLCNSKEFLEKRKERNKKAKQQDRICKYKFWEPPSTLRNTDPKMCAYVMKLRMLKMKAKPRYHAPYENVQYQIAGVAFFGGKPRYLLSNVAVMPTGYIAINEGLVYCNGEYVSRLNGYWRYPKEVIDKCDHTCDCLTKWEPAVMEFLQKSKCKCGHLYDFYNESISNKEKYFYPPTRHAPLWFDHAKVFQMDPMEDFIKETFAIGLKSETTMEVASEPTLNASGLKKSELLAAFLADLSDTPLLIPHLPQANLLNNLQEWARRRVRGKLEPKHHKHMMLQSQRRWLDLKHIDFRARAYRIPFTLKQLKNINWSHRKIIQKLFKILLHDFTMRNRLKQVEQTRLWWPTTKYDYYPNKPFLDIFFTYMSGRSKDTYLVNPYSSECTPKYGAKTCPLGN
ncbi:hypothetical protein PYW08_004486 [Mythimna loreyi]|uniref:Uncharacterized protein n=1 Tax=Mythimna loreyi TaxID=667449 RepID=A0ACC2QPF4_9NEOP|nr:hypothetical protein PYW08_004486 [Mythimna loreyi]